MSMLRNDFTVAEKMLRPDTDATTPSVAVDGPPGPGKTTLITRIIGALKQRGYRVATLRRAPHSDTVREGTDWSAFARAGSDAAGVISPDRIAITERTDEELPLEEILSRLPQVDIVLLEDFHSVPVPRIEVLGELNGPLRTPPPRLIAMVADTPHPLPVPRFGSDEVEAIAAFIERELRLQRRGDSRMAS